MAEQEDARRIALSLPETSETDDDKEALLASDGESSSRSRTTTAFRPCCRAPRALVEALDRGDA